MQRELREIKGKLDIKRAGGGKHPWYKVFTGPRMACRAMLVITLQALQQLTSVSFFYYGTSVLRPLDSQTSYVTSMILGSANFGTTFPGLYIVERFGRRPSLIAGALWMFMCFMVKLFVA